MNNEQTNAREIKFRGMGINGDWHYGLLANPKSNKTLSSQIETGGWYICNSVGMPFAYHVRPETIGQFTGLRDKNGVEIYEGDIVRFKDFQKFREDQYDRTALVVYYCEPNDRVGFAPMVWHTEVDDGYYNSEREQYEVIGNRYENPDLLGE